MKNNKTIVIMAWRDRWNPLYGGSEKFIQNMAEELSQKGINTIFLTARYKGSKRREIINSVKYIRLGNRFTLYLLVPIFYLLNLKRKTDLLIENFNAIPFFIPLYNNNNITVIHHIQVEEWKKMFGNFLGTILSKIMNKILLVIYRKQKIITVSKSSKEEILNHGFKPEELNIVYNGIDIPIKKDTSKPKDIINICYMGRVVKPKNIDRAIKLIDYAVKEMKIMNIRMEVGGNGPEVEYLRKLVNRLKLSDYVEVLGLISDEEKVSLLERSHLFIMLSHKEGWGITIIEAASQATPTLGYNVQGINDSLHPDTGYLIELDDNLEKTFQDILTQIQNDSNEYQSKKQKCLLWAKNFEWKAQKEKFWNIVRKELNL